jgi:CRISPR-associated Csx2 family protein
MARVLISFLGTGPLQDIETRKYKTATYQIDGFKYTTPFVSAALVEHLNIEKKIIIGTAKSMWEEYYRFFSTESNFDKEFYQELIRYTDKSNHKTTDFSTLMGLGQKLENTHIIILKYGLSEEELRDNISNVLEIDNILDKKDALYIDVTHGFRSFPLLAQQVVFYLKEVSSKKLKPRNFFYGMLDASRDLGYTPIVDLKIMFEMNEWILGANQFKTTTNADVIVSLIKPKNENLAKTLDEFSKALNLNYSNDIFIQLEKLRGFKTENIKNPEKLIVDKVISEFINHFSESDKISVFQYELSRWFYNKKSYSNAFIVLAESIVSLVCEKLQIDPIDRSNRENAKSKVYKFKDINNSFKKVVKIRNNIAHHLKGREGKVIDDIDELVIHFRNLRPHYKN